MHAAKQLDSTCGPVHKNETGFEAGLIFCAPTGIAFHRTNMPDGCIFIASRTLRV